jgi:hypothetical protein
MRRVVLLLGVLCAISFADEVSAYKAGWVDGFRVGYSLKQARVVDIPTGYWLYMPVEDMPMPLVGFYVFTAERMGLRAYLTDKEVVFGVFQRRADAEFYRQQLLGKGVDGVMIAKRSGTVGYEGSVLFLDRVGEEKRGVSGVMYHLSKAIEKAREIDPTVLNTALLVEDLEKILKEVSKWETGGKGYQRVIPDNTVNQQSRQSIPDDRVNQQRVQEVFQRVERLVQELSQRVKRLERQLEAGKTEGGIGEEGIKEKYQVQVRLRVRACPHTNCGVVVVLEKGEVVSLLSRRGNWAFIETIDGVRGWVLSKYLQEYFY